MLFRRPVFAAVIVVTITTLLPILVGAMAVQSTGLPFEISDKDFWRMIVDLSERGGDFSNENFVSNELQYQDVVPALKVTTKPGGVYIGVGPEQNFTYAYHLRFWQRNWGRGSGICELFPADEHHRYYRAQFVLPGKRRKLPIRA